MMIDDDRKTYGTPAERLAKAAIWLGGSALFGSLALVLWNRRALRSIQAAAEKADEPVLEPHLPVDNDIY
jgi:hypothetical protein